MQLSKCKYCGHSFLPGYEGTVDGSICYEHEYLIDDPIGKSMNEDSPRPTTELSYETEVDS